MVQGWKIFAHSVKQVFGNFGSAVRVSLVPALLQVLSVGLLFAWAANQGVSNMHDVLNGGLIPLIFLTMAIVSLLSLWIAVGWHRFVLLGEQVKGFPALHVGRMAGYLGKGFLIGLIMIVPGLVVVFVFASAMPAVASGGSGMTVIGAFAFLAIALLLTSLFYRLATVLPGVALQSGVSLGTGWGATRGQTGAIVVLALIAGVASQLMAVTGRLLPEGPAVQLPWLIVTTWITLMVGLSILTTLYGHYVEKRPLV